MDNRNRAEAIKFKLMPDGCIRAHDIRKGSGLSEWHIALSHAICDTLTTAHVFHFLTTDERIYDALRHAILQGD